jgi:hypothetical protein
MDCEGSLWNGCGIAKSFNVGCEVISLDEVSTGTVWVSARDEI